jgi:hypothetical protein
MRAAGGLILALGLAASVGGCATVQASVPPPDAGDALVATLGQAGGQVVLRPDQQLLVRLYLDEGTGLVWRVGKADHLVQITKAESMAGRLGRPLPASVGHGGVVQTFSFKAMGRGQGELVFVLRPSRDDYAPPKQIASYSVRVL